MVKLPELMKAQLEKRIELNESIINADRWIDETEKEVRKMQEGSQAFLDKCMKRGIKNVKENPFFENI